MRKPARADEMTPEVPAARACRPGPGRAAIHYG